MPAATSALVIGGGIAGIAAAISLCEAGVQVHLIDRDPDWKVYGAGITITGPTLRVLRRLGVLPRVLAEGYTADGILVCDPQGRVLSEIDTSGDGLEGLPGAGGIMRPTLHRILSERLLTLAPKVSLGVSVAAIGSGPVKQVLFDDGQVGAYDLIVGADGIFSQTRQHLFPDAAPPQYVGQVCWRLMTEKHPAITRRTYFLGGPCKVGMNPVSPTEMYMFLLEPMPVFQRCPEGQEHLRLAALMEPFGGVVAELHAAMNPASRIVARPLETVFIRGSWHKDGCVLIGDAAHATTPQLASGAGMAMEDGVVLGDCIAAAPDIDTALGQFMQRRYDRCALVVDNSLLLGRLEKERKPASEQSRVVEEALVRLNQPY